VYFASGAEFRDWLVHNGTQTSELVVGLFKTGAGRTGMSYREALDEALCFGWIDGVRRRIDDERYSIRFSPRKPRSIWSLANTARVAKLRRLGAMQPEGLKAFAARTEARTGIYSFESAPRKLSAEFEATFRCQPRAWNFFESRSPWYRCTASFWVMNAKKEETRQRRLGILIRDSASGRLIGPLRRPGSSKTSAQ
jgi:uncharacterized protein YdeI (YjbR/CyaY-like superfamily)